MSNNSPRIQNILQYLKRHNLVTVDELAKEMGVSLATIRRDIVKLDKNGTIARVHGGVTLNRFISNQPTTSEKITQNLREKRMIAEIAVKLIKPNQAIVLDAGTTTFEIAKRLIDIPLRIITPDLHIALYFSEYKQIEVTVVGGKIDYTSQSCIGDPGEAFLKGIIPDIAFISCNSWSIQHGVTTPTQQKNNLKKAILQNAQRKILVVDSSKYGKHSLFSLCALEEFDDIITDNGLEIDLQQEMTQLSSDLNLLIS